MAMLAAASSATRREYSTSEAPSSPAANLLAATTSLDIGASPVHRVMRGTEASDGGWFDRWSPDCCPCPATSDYLRAGRKTAVLVPLARRRWKKFVGALAERRRASSNSSPSN